MYNFMNIIYKIYENIHTKLALTIEESVRVKKRKKEGGNQSFSEVVTPITEVKLASWMDTETPR